MAMEDPTSATMAFRHLLQLSTDDWSQLSPHLYCLQDEDATRNLFRVSCGLDSMILGESQILGQVSDAYGKAAEAKTTGPFLSRLFQEAIAMGKRARSETPIGSRPVSLCSVAARAVQETHPDLNQQRVMIVGAGSMGRMAARYFRDLGVNHLVIVNRRLEHAQSLANEVHAEAAGWEALFDQLRLADVALLATAAPSFILGSDDVHNVMAHRPERSLTLVDLSVPRNVHPDVAKQPGIKLLDMDALGARIEEAQVARQETVPLVETLVEQAIVGFQRWQASRSVAPTIAGLYHHAEALREREVARTIKRIGNMSESDREAMEVLTRSIVDKLLQTPIRNLQTKAAEGNPDIYVNAIRELFARV